MSIAEEFVKFNVLGIEENLVSKEDAFLISKYQKKLDILKNYKPHDYMLVTYSKQKQLEIINDLKKRRGAYNTITFYNSRGKRVKICEAFLVDGRILLQCSFVRGNKTFRMWLDTLLSELQKRNITKFRPHEFKTTYFKYVYDEIKEIRKSLNDIYQKYNNIYKARKNSLKQEFDKEINKYKPVIKEVKVKKELSNQEALEKAGKNKGVERVKDYFNSRITEEEKKIFLDWISKNIYSIRVYGLLDGRSGNVLKNEYGNIEGNLRLRDIKKDDAGKVVSSDNLSAYISLKSKDNPPMDILKKITSTKRKGTDLFYGNRLNDTNLALFLLLEYRDKGFKAGIRNLYRQIINE